MTHVVVLPAAAGAGGSVFGHSNQTPRREGGLYLRKCEQNPPSPRLPQSDPASEAQFRARGGGAEPEMSGLAFSAGNVSFFWTNVGISPRIEKSFVFCPI